MYCLCVYILVCSRLAVCVLLSVQERSAQQARDMHASAFIIIISIIIIFAFLGNGKPCINWFSKICWSI